MAFESFWFKTSLPRSIWLKLNFLLKSNNESFSLWNLVKRSAASNLDWRFARRWKVDGIHWMFVGCSVNITGEHRCSPETQSLNGLKPLVSIGISLEELETPVSGGLLNWCWLPRCFESKLSMSSGRLVVCCSFLNTRFSVKSSVKFGNFPTLRSNWSVRLT